MLPDSAISEILIASNFLTIKDNLSDTFWIALELSILKIGFNIMLSSPGKKLDAFKFDGVAESDNTVGKRTL